MNVLMLNPPFLPRFSRSQRSPAVTKGGTLYYPIWLAYATGALEEAGHDVKLLDAPAAGHDLGYVLEVARGFRPGLVAIDTSTPSIYNDIRVAEAIKEAMPESFIILVGTHVSALPEESLSLSPEIAAVARHEYDYTLCDLTLALASGRDLALVEGISFRQDGKIVHNPDRPLIQDLDAIPFVSAAYKRHLRVEDYFYAMSRHPVVTIISGRGCPYQCTYCVIPQVLQMRGYRRRSVENVAAEFEYIQEKLPQVQEVFIEDDTLTVNRQRCRELSRQLIEWGVKLSWTANARADVDYETLRLMKEAGCRSLCVGFESGDQTILDNIGKKISIERMRQFMADARRAGLLVHGCFMVGNPGETRETMMKTLNFAEELNPDTAQFFPIMVYPGTIAYDWAKEQGYLTTTDYSQWLTAEGLHNTVVSRPDLTSQELVDFCDYARRAFYLRSSYIMGKLRQILLHPAEAKRTFKSLKSFLPYLLRSFGGARPSYPRASAAARKEGSH